MGGFYKQSKESILEKFGVNEKNGLTNKQVKLNREKYGENKLPEDVEDSYVKVFFKSFTDPIVMVLLGAVLLSFLSSYYAFHFQGDHKHGMEAMYEAIVILIIILISAFIGFWQEISARKTLNALKEMNSRYTTVLRDSEWSKVLATELVVGDMVKVQVGDFVEADIRLIRSDELQVIEAHLTGESDAIAKNTDPIEEDTELGDRLNMGFSGSIVSNGQGIGVVVAVGENSELGKISKLIQSEENKKSPLQFTINKLTKSLMKFSAGLVLFTFIVGVVRSGEINFESIAAILSTSIALAVASIPDALPAVLSIVLTIGAAKMAKNNGLIKALNSVETLGITCYIR